MAEIDQVATPGNAIVEDLKRRGAMIPDSVGAAAIIDGWWSQSLQQAEVRFQLDRTPSDPIPHAEHLVDYGAPGYVELLTFRGNRISVPLDSDIVVEERSHRDTDISPDQIPVAVLIFQGRECVTRVPYLHCLAMFGIITPEAAGMTDADMRAAGMVEDGVPPMQRARIIPS